MKLLSKVGDTLLAKVVPGIDAKAACGPCSYAGFRCCGPGGSYRRYIYTDRCGELCYTRCEPGTVCTI